jgi:hypothetical protein
MQPIHLICWIRLHALALALTVAACTAQKGGVFTKDSNPPLSQNSQVENLVSKDSSAVKPKLQISYAKVPLHFEPNQGQTDEQVNFLSRGRGYTEAISKLAELVVFAVK